MAARINQTGLSAARGAIRTGRINRRSSWGFSVADGNRLLGAGNDNFNQFSRAHLGLAIPVRPRNTKAAYRYPFGKLVNGQFVVYRSGLVAIRQRAGQQRDTAIFTVAGGLLEAVDRKRKALDEDYPPPKWWKGGGYLNAPI